VLADPPTIDLRDRTLGFQVVGRLATPSPSPSEGV